MDNSTIAAIATPPGRGGIGIIRLSGNQSLETVRSIFRRPDQKWGAPPHLNSHTLYYGHIVDREKNKTIDEVLLVFMKAPKTYTREDVVEIQAHSGPIVLNAILELVTRNGVRLAEPGEFTKRAFLNGRIDLTQAEAVIDIINARSGEALEIAVSQIKGNLLQHIRAIRNRLRDVLVEIEALIDFPDEMETGEAEKNDTHTDVLSNIVADLSALITRYDNMHFYREGLKIAIIGRPNVGKSTLLNKLVEKDRAIVTDIPGTTRDLIEEPVNIDGIPVIFGDTAGLRETTDPVESQGVKKAIEYIETADILLCVMSAAENPTQMDSDMLKLANGKKRIIVFNKSDLLQDGKGIDFPHTMIAERHVSVSALYDQGIGELKNMIAGDVKLESCPDRLVPNLRQKICFEATRECVVSACEGLHLGIPDEMIAVDIREAMNSIGEITGETVGDDLLDHIFEKFCIGK